MVKKSKKVKRSKEANEKHPWDETLVIAVLVASALSVLLLLASYISVTGEAYSSIPTREGVLNVLNGATVVEGSGKAKCTVQCKSVGQICILAHQNEVIVDCNAKIVGSYNCLCSSVGKVIATIPQDIPNTHGNAIKQEALPAPPPGGETKVVSGIEYEVSILFVQENKCILNVNGFTISVNLGQTKTLEDGANITLNSVNVNSQECSYTII